MKTVEYLVDLMDLTYMGSIMEIFKNNFNKEEYDSYLERKKSKIDKDAAPDENGVCYNIRPSCIPEYRLRVVEEVIIEKPGAFISEGNKLCEVTYLFKGDLNSYLNGKEPFRAFSYRFDKIRNIETFEIEIIGGFYK